MNHKKCPKMSEATKDKLRLIDEYEKSTGDKSGNLMLVAHWAHKEGKFPPPAYNPVKLIAKSLATACRQDYIDTEKGPVRRRHAYIPKGDPNQKTFSWFKIEDATPEKMKLSSQGRRNGTLLDLLQLVRDLDYYNDNYNPGDPIEVDPDFTPDIEELRMPPEYPDSPPDDSGDDNPGEEPA
jgi:hypothetical protein